MGKSSPLNGKKQRDITSQKMNEKPNLNEFLLASLNDDFDTNLEDKLKCLKTFYAKCKYKDIEKVVKESELVFWQKN